jgi:hypothetical protein
MTRILPMTFLCLAALVGCDNSASRAPSGPAKGGVKIDVPGVKVEVNEDAKKGVKVDVLPKKE